MYPKLLGFPIVFRRIYFVHMRACTCDTFIDNYTKSLTISLSTKRPRLTMELTIWVQRMYINLLLQQ